MIKIHSLFVKIISIMVCVVVGLSASGIVNANIAKGAESTSHDNVLTIFSVEDYINLGDPENDEPGVLDLFETENPGVKVNYLTFATNEEMYNELVKDPYSCDLICPSEYMIMKMMTENLIRPFETPNNFKTYGSEYIKDVFKGLKITDQNGQVLPLMSEDESTSYAVGYMWGTLGLIYRMDALTEEDLNTWSCLWNKEYDGRVTIKDSIRDSYFMALAYVYKDELMEAKSLSQEEDDAKKYREKITEIFNRTDMESVKKVEKALLDLKNNLYGFEVDGGKSDILTGKIDINVAWSGDAVYALYQGLYDEETEEVLDDPVKLGYAIPEEGANVWFDGYVMTKNADYDKAINFLDFIARPDIAVMNMDYTGYTPCIAGDEVFEYVKESYDVGEGEVEGKEFDLAYFFGKGGDYKIKVSDFSEQMFMAQFPTEEIINRCAIMQNFDGEELQRINEMWKKVKLVTLSDFAIITITIVLVLVVVAVATYKIKKKFFLR